MRTLRVGLAQINTTVGDLDGNVARVLEYVGRARDLGGESVSPKQRLPNYGVFDEMRYFSPGQGCSLYIIAGVGVGVNVCEDIWYPGEPTLAQAQAGAQVIVNINGSPYHAGKREFRQQMLATRAGDYGVFVCYTNQVGGQDERVFDGGSLVLIPAGA